MQTPELNHHEAEYEKWKYRSNFLYGIPAATGASALVARMPIEVAQNEELMDIASYTLYGSIAALVGGALLSAYKLVIIERQIRQENGLKIPE